MRKLIVLSCLMIVITACINNKPVNKDEGIITYKIEYPENIQEKGYASFLPSKMVTTFKDKNYKVTIKGDLSLYQLEYISRGSEENSTTLFRVFDKRMYHDHEKGEYLFLFEKSCDTKVEFIETETKEIAGFVCKKAVVHFADKDLPSIDVYYSEDIKFSRPKENSPYDNIPGALLQFRVPFKDLNFTFTAQSVELKKINDKAFLVPENYTRTERGEIDELVGSLIQ